MRRTGTVIPALMLAGCVGEISTPQGMLPPECNGGPHAAVTSLHRLTTPQYQHAIDVIFGGQVKASAAYPPGFGTSVTGYSTEEAINEVGEQGASLLQRAAEGVAVDVVAALPALLPCSSEAAPGQSCLDAWLDTVGRRAFRRRLTAEERAALQRPFDATRADGGDFNDGIAVVTATLLQAPQFLYAVEDAAPTARPLTDDELASRLALLLWDSVPDDALLDLAAQGQLKDRDVFAQQARRMFDDPRAAPAIARAMREWTQVKTLVSSDKDPTLFPFFTAGYAKSLNESFDRFVVDQVRTGGSLSTLLTTNAGWVDGTLAPVLGFPAPDAGWAKVTFDPSHAAGLLTHPLLLASNAHPAKSSFVFRGRTLAKRLLCVPLGDPPANALAEFATVPLPPNPSAREVASAIEARPSCAGCHAILDGPGLAFEHFDAVGNWRDADEQGRAIDTTGHLLGSGQAITFSSPTDLAAQLAARPEVGTCLANQLFRFTFSRAETGADTCAVKTMQAVIADKGGRLDDAFLAVTTTQAFAWRVDQ